MDCRLPNVAVDMSSVKEQLLVELYGRDGVNPMRGVKRAPDPVWKLATSVLPARIRHARMGSLSASALVISHGGAS